MKRNTKMSDSAKTESKSGEPMDKKAKEILRPVALPNVTRNCWALETLVREMLDLFPETGVAFGNYDGRNTALDAVFDLSMLDPEDRDLAAALLQMLTVDHRVDDAVYEESEALATVSIKSGPRTQDLRDPFGLADAFDVITAEEGRQP